MADIMDVGDELRAVVKHKGGRSDEASAATTTLPVSSEANVGQNFGSLQEAYIYVESRGSNPMDLSNPQIYLILGNRGTILLHTLSKEERNRVVRQNPGAVVAACQNAAYRELANKRGVIKEDGVVAFWTPSFIPFHLGYTIVRDGVTCQHLVSARDKRVKEPAQYAKEIIPLAKSFLMKPYGSYQPHFPFTWATSHSSGVDAFDTRDLKAKATMEHGQLIGSRYKDLEAMGIEMAEATAKLINTNKLIPGLLELIISPGRRTRELVAEANELKELQLEKNRSDPSNSKLILPKAGNTGITDTSMAEARSDSGRNLIEQGKARAKPTASSSKAKNQAKNIHSQGLIEPSHAVYNKNKNQKPIDRRGVTAKMSKDEMIAKPSHDPEYLESNKANKKAKTKKNRPKTARPSHNLLDKTNDGLKSVTPAQQQLPERAFPIESKHPLHKTSSSRQEAVVSMGMPTPGSIVEPEPPLRRNAKDAEIPALELPLMEGLEFGEANLDSKSITEDRCTPPISPSREPLPQTCAASAKASTEPLADCQQQCVLDGNLAATGPTPTPAEPCHQPVTTSRLPSSVLKPYSAMNCQGAALKEDDLSTIDHATDEDAVRLRCYPGDRIDDEHQQVPKLCLAHGGDHHGSSSSDSTRNPDLMTKGAQNLAWTYDLEVGSDEGLINAGIRLWEVPPTYFYPHSVPTMLFDHKTPARVIVCHDSTGTLEPSIEYDGEVVQIVPHSEPWEDVRSQESHPDYLPPCKLVEYQACEAAGYWVWRHDRHFVKCRKLACKTLVMDYDPSAVFCQGCGPKTLVRYCCFQHQIDDVKDHWAECGDPRLVLQYVIDHDSTPLHFSHKPPAIIERNGVYGIRSAKLHRQKIFAMRNGGYYTLFDPKTQAPKTLSWPKTVAKWQELDDRVERLLNIAFFDALKVDIIRYLYRLLRELLRASGEWNHHTEQVLKTQIRKEFDPGREEERDPALVRDDAPCGCEWSGEPCLLQCHNSTRQGHAARGHPQFHPSGLKIQVDTMEYTYWILRAWRQQHPIEKDWRIRANGCGLLPLRLGEDVFELGPGWTGWGGLSHNIRGPDWALAQGLQEVFFGYGDWV